MATRRLRLALAAVALAASAGVATGLVLTLTGGSTRLSDADYARLFRESRVGEPMAAVLARWPKDVYQQYADNLNDECYEWQDNRLGKGSNLASHLYNLCFKRGVLRSKEVF